MEPIDPLVERVLNDVLGRGNTTQVMRVEGMGSLWNGIAIGIALGAALALVVWVGSTMNSIRNEVQAERQSRESMNNWTAQEVTAIRSYITNGRLQPMKPRPTTNEEPQK